MPDANQQGVDDPADLGPAPREVPEEAQMGDDQMGADDAEEAQDPEEPREPGEPLEPYEVMLQGFCTVTQTLSAAYGAACDEIQAIVRKSLAKTTAEDWTFVWGASGAIHSMANLRQAGNGLYGEECQRPGRTTGRGSEGREGCPGFHP